MHCGPPNQNFGGAMAPAVAPPMMNNEDECDQTTFVSLKDLTKPSSVGKTSETFEASNNVVVIC